MSIAESPQAGIYRTQHSGRNTTMNVDDGSHLNVAGKLTQPGTLANGHLPLGTHLFGARNLASAENFASGSSAPTAFWGGLLMPDGEPSLALVSSDSAVFFLKWTSANVAAIKLPPVALPNDFSTAGGLTIELSGESVGTGSASDAISAITIEAYFGAAGTNVGSTHPNFTSTPGWQGITVASGSVATGTLNITLVPQAHGNRAIRLYDARLSYTKKTS